MRFKADLGLAESRLNRRPSNPSTAAPPHRRPVARAAIGHSKQHRQIDRQITERPNQRSPARHYDRLEKRLIPRHELTPLREQAMSEIPLPDM